MVGLTRGLQLFSPRSLQARSLVALAAALLPVTVLALILVWPAGGGGTAGGVPLAARFGAWLPPLLVLLAALLSLAVATYAVRRSVSVPVMRLCERAEAFARDGAMPPRSYRPPDELAPLLVGLDRLARLVRVKEADMLAVQRIVRLGTWRMSVATGETRISAGVLEVTGLPQGKGRLSREEFILLFEPEDRQPLEQFLENALASNRIQRGQFRFLRQQASEGYCRIQAGRELGPDGRVLALFGYLQDVTDMQLLELQLRESEKMRALGDLTGGIAHDFNNLLTVIMGNAELLCERAQPGSGESRMAELILISSEKASELTRRLLAFARRQPLQPVSLDLTQLTADLEGILSRSLGEDITLQFRLPDDLWAVRVDPSELENAVLNLALNARDAMPDGGLLSIEAENISLARRDVGQFAELEPGDYVALAVSDTGSGMLPEVVQRALEPFFTTKAGGRGSGLGLSMVFGFVKQSGGHVRIYSEPDQGTTIRMYLPRSSDPAEPAVIAADTALLLGSETILLVEDDPLVREHVGEQLGRLGYSVVMAEDAAQALEQLQQGPSVQLLFTDVVLSGGTNGRQLAEAAQRIKPGLPVLYTSGYAQSALVHFGRLDSEVELLSKPYGLQELSQKLRRLLDRTQSTVPGGLSSA